MFCIRGVGGREISDLNIISIKVVPRGTDKIQDSFMLGEVGMQDKRWLCCNVNICLCYNETSHEAGGGAGDHL